MRLWVWILSCLLGLAGSLPAQSLDSTLIIEPPLSQQDLDLALRQQRDPQAQVYAQATELGDWPTAISALHQLLAKDPENIYLQDSLAALYHRVGNLHSCRLWCAKVLDKRPDNRYLLRLAASIDEAQGDIKSALTQYERLYALSAGLYDRYKTAALQFQLGRYGECAGHVQAMLADPSIEAEQLHFEWKGGSADVPMRAALLNLQGNLDLALNRSQEARQHFKAALALAPHFELARNNLEAAR